MPRPESGQPRTTCRRGRARADPRRGDPSVTAPVHVRCVGSSVGRLAWTRGGSPAGCSVRSSESSEDQAASSSSGASLPGAPPPGAGPPRGARSGLHRLTRSCLDRSNRVPSGWCRPRRRSATSDRLRRAALAQVEPRTRRSAWTPAAIGCAVDHASATRSPAPTVRTNRSPGRREVGGGRARCPVAAPEHGEVEHVRSQAVDGEVAPGERVPGGPVGRAGTRCRPCRRGSQTSGADQLMEVWPLARARPARPSTT